MKIAVDTLLYNPSLYIFDWDKKRMLVSFYNKIKGMEETKKIHTDKNGFLYFWANGTTYYKHLLFTVEYKEINL